MAAAKKRTNYQSFPDQAGGSQSFDKLTQLRLPPLAGKSFLDVGCNEGFFCGYAKYRGAKRVVGLDMNAGFLERASARFPDCEFLNQTWDKLPEGKFDVILLASALHYAEDQPALILRLVNHLSPDGTLVLELGIVSSSKNEWVPVKRSIDTRYFPTMPKLKEVLEPFAWKYVGTSVNQVGDPIGRYVIHIKRRRPIAYLLMLPSSYGKTYVANSLFPKAGVPIVMGDVLLDDIAKGKIAVSSSLASLISKTYKKGEVDRVIRELFAENLGNDFIAAWADSAKLADIAFDGFIPDKYQEDVCRRLRQIGFFPVRMNWGLIGDPLVSPQSAKDLSEGYGNHLRANSGSASSELSLPNVKPKQQPETGKAPALIQKWKAEENIGFVDKLGVEDEEIIISGWAVDKEGLPPKSFIIHVLGADYYCDNASVISRPDVQNALGLNQAGVGYSIRLQLGKTVDEKKLLENLSVTAGDKGHGKRKPFRISTRIKSGKNA